MIFLIVIISLLIYVAYAMIIGIKWGNLVDKYVDIGNTRTVITTCGIIVISAIPWILAYLLDIIVIMR